ncbi:type II secretion system protein N [Haliea sp. E1-2-M8]|uniref:type II secretion system protein N n=1 Tax=Haliea sp. E1-2-M8 TaxID=3064706 RepID=UPI00271D0938|nr:type II secretion system protein N [Haliea sp. E1-2-M8]MDO8862214.1 type II secretion system protein N [Haliea sp. E1-2-M8]
MTGGRWLAGVLALVLLLLLLAISAPAHLLLRLLENTPVTAEGLQGTVWRGSAGRVLVATDVGLLHLGEVSWSLQPWSLLTLAPRLEVESHWGGQRLQAEVQLRGRDDISLEHLDASFDAALIRHLAPVALQGVVSLQAQQLHLRDGLPVQAQGRVLWQQAVWDSPRGMLPLGSYVLEIAQPRGGELTGEVLTLEGPVRATGQLQLARSSYSIAVLISNDGNWDPQLQEALSLLARPVAEGYDLRLEGQLPVPGT